VNLTVFASKGFFSAIIYINDSNIPPFFFSPSWRKQLFVQKLLFLQDIAFCTLSKAFLLTIFSLSLPHSIMTERKITSEPDKNFKLIGIASAERDYRLCYMLTEALEWEISRLPNQEIELKERSLKLSVAVFRAEQALTHSVFYLFANKSAGELLLPEAGNFDYLLKTEGAYKGIKDLLKKLKQIDAVLTASEIPVKSLKNYDRMAYEEPMEKPEVVVKRKGK